MNSSGIKRGLAGSAVAALAITGLPFLASSANAAAGDTLTVVSAGPAKNGGTEGAVVVLRAKHGTVTATDLALTATNDPKVGSQDNADQSASIITGSADTAQNPDVAADPSDANYDLITLHIKTTTSTTGNTASFRVIDNDGSDADNLEASEARVNVSVSTAGAVDKVEVSPASQSVAQGLKTGAYTVTLKDAAGRTTQLDNGDVITVTNDPATDLDVTPSDLSIDADEIGTGSDSFTVSALPGAALGSHKLKLDGPGSADASATVVVTKAASIDKDNVDIVTGADSWDGFGDDNLGGITEVRVDQSTVTINIKDSDPNSTVSLSLNGAKYDATTNTGGGATDVTFGGKTTSTVSTVLDADGNGSLTITPDAGTIQDGDIIQIGGSFVESLKFDRVTPTAMQTADKYFSAVGGSVDVTATVVDQFGDPVTGGYVTAARNGVNNDTAATTQKKAVGSDGSVTFTFTDAKAANGDTDTVTFKHYKDQYATGTDMADGSTIIKYTTDGMGSDFKTKLDSTDTEAKDYKASDVSVVPLADADADDTTEYAPIEVDNGEAGSDITVSVDNGALILPDGVTDLSKGKSSITDTVDNATQKLTGYNIVGTKSGLVTVTVTSANRTETAQMTVSDETATWSARNVTVSGPAEVEHGTTQIPFTAVVTDAFGNPVVGVPFNHLNVQVTGPAQFQDSDAMTNAAGQINLNVRVDSDAAGAVNIKVTGLDSEFGAAADRLWSNSTTDDAKGFAASSSVATAMTTVKDAPLPPVVELKSINLDLRGNDNGAKDDVLRANANRNGAGLTAKLYRKTSNGLKWLASAPLNSRGNHKFRVADQNGNKATKYVVKVAKTDTTQHAYDSKKVR